VACDVQNVKEGAELIGAPQLWPLQLGISCLEVCSRTDKSRNTWSVIVKVCS
jgi:hypothetical protein